MPPSPTGDYTSFILSLTHISPLTVLSLFFLGLFRIAPIVGIAPFLGSKMPQGVRVGASIALTLIILPKILTTATHPIAFDATFIAYSIKEFFIGTLIAFLVSVPFFIAESSGVYIDFMRGSSALMVQDPTTQAQVSPIGLLYNYVLIVLFYQINGPFFFLDGLMQTYSYVPADSFINPVFFMEGHPFWSAMIGLTGKIFALSIQFAAPSLVAVLMAEMFLGIANRLAPQVQIAFLGMSIKSLLAIALLFVAWLFILKQLGDYSLTWLQELQKLLSTL